MRSYAKQLTDLQMRKALKYGESEHLLTTLRQLRHKRLQLFVVWGEDRIHRTLTLFPDLLEGRLFLGQMIAIVVAHIADNRGHPRL